MAIGGQRLLSSLPIGNLKDLIRFKRAKLIVAPYFRYGHTAHIDERRQFGKSAESQLGGRSTLHSNHKTWLGANIGVSSPRANMWRTKLSIQSVQLSLLERSFNV